jgi:hypothetical protein
VPVDVPLFRNTYLGSEPRASWFGDSHWSLDGHWSGRGT